MTRHTPTPEELTLAVMQALADRERLSRAARDRAVALFDLRPWLERHKAIFREVLKGRRS